MGLTVFVYWVAFEFHVCISQVFFSSLFPVSLILLWVHEMDAGLVVFLLVSTLDVLNTRFFSIFFSAFIYLYFTLSHSFF